MLSTLLKASVSSPPLPISAVAFAHFNSPFITAYPWSSSGFGTKYTNPSTLPTGTGSGVAFSPDKSAIAVAHQSSPSITAYPWSGSGFGTKYTNPATLPVSGGLSVAFSSNGSTIAVGHENSPNITLYPWSSSGFGTKYNNPGSPPAGGVNGVAFSPASLILQLHTILHPSSQYILGPAQALVLDQ